MSDSAVTVVEAKDVELAESVLVGEYLGLAGSSQMELLQVQKRERYAYSKLCVHGVVISMSWGVVFEV